MSYSKNYTALVFFNERRYSLSSIEIKKDTVKLMLIFTIKGDKEAIEYIFTHYITRFFGHLFLGCSCNGWAEGRSEIVLNIPYIPHSKRIGFNIINLIAKDYLRNGVADEMNSEIEKIIAGEQGAAASSMQPGEAAAFCGTNPHCNEYSPICSDPTHIANAQKRIVNGWLMSAWIDIAKGLPKDADLRSIRSLVWGYIFEEKLDELPSFPPPTQDLITAMNRIKDRILQSPTVMDFTLFDMNFLQVPAVPKERAMSYIKAFVREKLGL